MAGTLTVHRPPLLGQLEVTVLDVGHGNSTLIRSNQWAAVVDVPPGVTMYDELRNQGITRLDHLILSHADRDHLGGAMRLLGDPDIEIGTLWVNPDPTKGGPTWRQFRTTAHQAARDRGVITGGFLVDTTPHIVAGRLRLEVLHPDLDWALSGVGSLDTRTDTNTMSAVIRVWLDEVPAVLLAADVTAAGLQRITDLGVDVNARVLVFPHHGGHPGHGRLFEFAERLTERVRPELVVFSFGRGVYRNPQPRIVLGVRTAVPLAAIRCTQLSQHCAEQEERRPTDHLSGRCSAGRASGSSCAGSLTIRLEEGVLVFDPPPTVHAAFVDEHTDPDRALCRCTMSKLAETDRARDLRHEP